MTERQQINCVQRSKKKEMSKENEHEHLIYAVRETPHLGGQ